MSGATQDEDKKPDQGAHINLKVKGQDGNEVFFRIKRSTQLRKLMNAYCDRQSVDFNAIAFLFDGRRLRGEQTPDELEMEDGDEQGRIYHRGGALKSGAEDLNRDCQTHLNIFSRSATGDEIDAMLHQTGGSFVYPDA
ncbi:Small ubiquitin-related modifier [Rhynchospora pubera]|uniref:Small ubiquitin-related modifier n=1 Tax=Rhynchospora pubera TaxID=906938 RepID=A0AAV8HDQ4_9POAL|nr:Small ubiquitin-related modifier [Rhynchospora pubera]